MIENQPFKSSNLSIRKAKLLLQEQFSILYKEKAEKIIYSIDGLVADFESYNTFIGSVGLQLADYVNRIQPFVNKRGFKAIYNTLPSFSYRLWVAMVKRAEKKYYHQECDQLMFIEMLVAATKKTIKQLNPTEQ